MIRFLPLGFWRLADLIPKAGPVGNGAGGFARSRDA